MTLFTRNELLLRAAIVIAIAVIPGSLIIAPIATAIWKFATN